jgi:hypothetical protein
MGAGRWARARVAGSSRRDDARGVGLSPREPEKKVEAWPSRADREGVSLTVA